MLMADLAVRFGRFPKETEKSHENLNEDRILLENLLIRDHVGYLQVKSKIK
jgi:hypothetical protein